MLDLISDFTFIQLIICEEYCAKTSRANAKDCSHLFCEILNPTMACDSSLKNWKETKAVGISYLIL